MDRRQVAAPLARAGWTIAIALAGAACSGLGASRVSLPPGTRVLARGSLAYAAHGGADAVVTIELEERFALVVRDPDSGRARVRVDLGAAEHDLGALAVAGARAWVGGDDRQVREIDLTRGAVVRSWPVGVEVTALRWLAGDWLAIGDARGAVCLRRLADGALVQCAVLAAAAVTSLRGGGGLTVEVGTTRATWTVPALRPTATAPAQRWRNAAVVVRGREVRVGGQLLARLGERVRSVAVGPHGELVIAAWITDLDDPSVVTIPR